MISKESAPDRYADYELKPPVLGRNYIGWLFLGILFFLLIGSTFLVNTTHQANEKDTTTLATELKRAISKPALTDAVPVAKNSKAKALVGSGSDSLGKVLGQIAKDDLRKPSFSELYGITKFELHQKIEKKDILSLMTGSASQRALFDILTSTHLAPTQAANLTASIPNNSFLHALERADAYEKAGDPVPRKRLYDELQRTQIIAYVSFGAVAFSGVLLWIIFLSLKSSGGLKPLGLPNLPISIFGADALAAKAVVFFGAYIVLMVVVQLAARNSLPMSVLGAGMTIAIFPLLFRYRGGGGALSFESLGFKGGGFSFWKYAALGLAGFLMEYPLSLTFGEVGEMLFSHQTFTHPAEVELVGSHNPWVVVSLFLLASLQAPLYEEMIFRGLMLPAIARLTGLIPSIVITSCLFAFLHPQGVGAWLGLATIAASSCVLIYHTRSLVPSIVLHGLHNGFTLCMVLLIS